MMKVFRVNRGESPKQVTERFLSEVVIPLFDMITEQQGIQYTEQLYNVLFMKLIGAKCYAYGPDVIAELHEMVSIAEDEYFTAIEENHQAMVGIEIWEHEGKYC